MAFFVILVLAVIGVFAWQFIESRNAVATTSVLTSHSPEQATEIINEAFGGARSVLWTNARGPGAINKRRRGFRGGISMSIDIEPQPDGVTRIDMWASETVVYLGLLVNFAGVVSRRKRAIARLLTEPAAQPAGAGRPGGGAAPGPGQPARGVGAAGAAAPTGTRGAAASGTVYLAAGRRLRSGNSPQECAAILLEVFDGYRPRKYQDLPPLVPTGVRWAAGEGAPAISLSGRDQDDSWLLVTLAPVPGGTEAGIFSLESAGQLSVVGHWKTRDSSLTSVGTWPARTVALTTPPVSDGIAAATLAANGYPATPGNQQRMAAILLDQFLVKSYVFVEGRDGAGAARRFVDEQRRRADYSSAAGPLRSTLQALADWNSQVLPYIQDLPLRAHALLLSVARETGNGGVWEDLRR